MANAMIHERWSTMRHRTVGPLAVLAAGLFLGLATPAAWGELLPTKQPKDVPFDSDPEVPNEAWMGPSSVDRIEAVAIVRPTDKPRQSGWLYQFRRFAAYFITHVRGGMPR
jgi:hypothetical protein